MVGEEIRDASREGLSLSRARRRENLQDGCARSDGLALCGIEAIEDGIHNIPWVLGFRSREEMMTRQE